MSCPAVLNLCFTRGATWIIPGRLTQNNQPVSLAGATVAAKLRKDIDDAAAAATWNCSVVNATNGQFQCVLAATTTATLEFDPSDSDSVDFTTYWYDVFITLSNGTVLCPLAGLIQMRPEVTR